MIGGVKEDGILLNFSEHENGDAFIVFIIRGKGFIKGLLKAEMKRFAGDLKPVHYISVSFFNLNDQSAELAISQLKMKKPAYVSRRLFKYPIIIKPLIFIFIF
jgi:hypothetical protein